MSKRLRLSPFVVCGGEAGVQPTNYMTKNNIPERDEVCLCDTVHLWAGWRGGRYFPGVEAPRYHQDDCPFFQDYSISAPVEEPSLVF